MPVRKVKGGFRFGKKGKIYPTRSQAARQGRAIRANIKQHRRVNRKRS